MYRNTTQNAIRVVGFRMHTVYSNNPLQCRRIMTPTRILLSDPWSLPHTPQHLSSTTTPPTRTQIPPLPRHNEDKETIRARLVYQSRKRGTLESDLLLSTFAKEHLDNMSLEELREYDKLLDEQDWDIYYWSTNNRTPPEKWAKSSLLEKLKTHAKNEGKVIRKMPSL